MSKYENYERVSRDYDSQRLAAGSDAIAAMIQLYCGKPLKDLHVLDAGCGTGNYAKALIEYGVGNVTLLDASTGMLEKARVKLADEIKSGKVKDVVEAAMPPIPFPDGTFDAVMFNLVLHYMKNHPDGEHFPVIEKVLTDAKRVVKKDGVMANTSGPPPRVYDTVWFVHLNPDIDTRHLKHYPHDRQWHAIFRKCGLQCTNYSNINVDIPEKTYKTLIDPGGPLKKEWRTCNSYWASATEEDIKAVEKNVIEMKNNGTLQKFVETHVLHHLDKEDDIDFPNAMETLKDGKRALKPDGVIIASVIHPCLMSKSVWFSQLDVELTEKYNKRLPSLDQYQHMFDNIEVKCMSKLNILGSSILKDYYRLDGPLDPAWRHTVSYWKFATEEDLNRIEKKLTELKETGQLEKWVMEHDHTESRGFLTILTCKLT